MSIEPDGPAEDGQMRKTQTECKAAYKAALANFLSELSDIDNETPWSNFEPAWWLQMKAVERSVLAALSAAKE